MHMMYHYGMRCVIKVVGMSVYPLRMKVPVYHRLNDFDAGNTCIPLHHHRAMNQVMVTGIAFHYIAFIRSLIIGVCMCVGVCDSRRFGAPFTGHGVGLPTARQYTRSMGGDLVLRSAGTAMGTTAAATFERRGTTSCVL